MKTWTPEGHLTDWVLELRAAGEAATRELRATDEHLEACPACRAREVDWRRLIDALESLPALKPSASFDQAVMARVRTRAAAARLPALARRLRPVAVAAAAVWSAAVVGGAIWLSRVDLPAGALIARGLGGMRDLLWAGILKLGAMAHVSGFLEFWSQAVGAVPGSVLLSAAAAMTAASALAIYTLYRVIDYQPSTFDAHV